MTNESGGSRNDLTLGYQWREDLLSAADSVTDAMSSLVFEYNAGNALIVINHIK